MTDHPIIGIIVVGYNRVGSIERLLKRLAVCDYSGITSVPLIVSLDNCGKSDVYDAASDFHWPRGSYQVILQPERMGCKNHILHCGDYMEQFGWDAAIVLEDDVYPSAAFYRYAQQAVARYQDDDRIAGIALYAMPQNQTVRLPFTPVLSEYDTYFMQLAQSCGQVWMKRQWDAFANWYAENSAPFSKRPGIPANVCRWPESSWLKYHIRYCIEENKYFVYPYESLTTNFSDVGQHTGVASNTLQVRLQQQTRQRYFFPELDNAPVVYDAWHENLRLAEVLGLAPETLNVDIFGGKGNPERKRYWLTTLCKPYHVLRSFALSLFPMDMNVLCGLAGDQIFLYDTTVPAEAPPDRDRDLQMWAYYNRILFPDEMIWKLSKPIVKRIRKSRWRYLLHPIQFLKLLRSRLRRS
ncbi:MAG: hypothetical protein IKO68_13175 [Oscillospiraceae bacterium]|nr:hypothetical protein [Oscillospiraceae bacterium]